LGTLGDIADRLFILYIVEQDCELIAAEASDGIARPESFQKARPRRVIQR
jgi:hypothetical protein